MLDDLKEKWPEILDFFKQEYDIADVSFKTWILPLEVESFDNNMITLVFPGESGKTGLQYINKKYLALLKISIEETLNQELELQIILPNETVSKIEDESSKISSVSQEDISLENRILDANLNKKYTFDSFVVGSNNNIAQVTSLAVAESPGDVYNPLFIYGGVGLGKTHLIQSIGNFVLKNNPSAKVLYTTSESFTNEVIDLLRKKKTNQEEIIEFRKKYRSVDVLLIDDIQFMANKSETQQELFHTFNSLYNQNKQIIFTSDRPPKELNGIEQRLISRFEQGLLADIAPPEYETRIAIIKRKAELYGMNLPDSIVDFLADKLKTNIRQLEGAITKINALTLVTGSTPTLNMAQQVVRDIQSNHEPIPLTVEKIIAEVGKIYSVTPEDMRSQKRSSQISTARQVAIYVVNRITGLSYSNIGVEFGNRDHSTIVYAINKVKSTIKKDPTFKGMVDDMIKNLGNNA